MTRQRLKYIRVYNTTDIRLLFATRLLQDDALQPSAVVWHIFRYLGFEKFFGNSAVCYKIFNQNTITLGVGTPAQITSPLPAPTDYTFYGVPITTRTQGKQ